uniref:Uncharacterized protein n=1 Tax=Anguilla anguilla TaxID=7936 RepID=A0A0E9SUK5_ANGAN
MQRGRRPLAFDTTVICWKVRRSWTWMLFSSRLTRILY